MPPLVFETSRGQLKENESEKIKYFYNASGLVTEILKNNYTRVMFFYNDKGYSVKKEAYKSDGSGLDYTEHYVRDAAGITLAIYRDRQITEHTIYGASRLGVYNRTDGSSCYQLTDHLGSVRAVVTRQEDGSAVALVATDYYYPFGMPMPNRNLEGNCRYGYQGEFAEKEPEIGNGRNSFQLRLWDSRIGRWLSPDPYGQYHSPYLGMGNNPINGVDPDGGCFKNGEDCNLNAKAGTTMVGDAGHTWTMGKDGWAMSGADFAQYGTTVYGFLNANNVDPIVGVDITDIPVDMNTGLFLVKLKEGLIANGFNNNIQVVPIKNVDFGIYASVARWWNNTPRSTLTIRNYHGYKDAGHDDAGGYSTLGSNSALVYNGLGPTLRHQETARNIYMYVNTSMHEIGHANLRFTHDKNGHTNFAEGIMDYRSNRSSKNLMFSPGEVTTIKTSVWGN